MVTGSDAPDVGWWPLQWSRSDTFMWRSVSLRLPTGTVDIWANEASIATGAAFHVRFRPYTDGGHLFSPSLLRCDDELDLRCCLIDLAYPGSMPYAGRS